MIENLAIAVVSLVAGCLVGYSFHKKSEELDQPAQEWASDIIKSDRIIIRVLSKEVENLLDQLDQQRKQP